MPRRQGWSRARVSKALTGSCRRPAAAPQGRPYARTTVCRRIKAMMWHDSGRIFPPPPARALPRPGKFAEQPARRRQVGRVGGFRGQERAETARAPVLANLCAPSSRFAVKADALETGRVVSLANPIGGVGRLGRAPQVIPAVVRAIRVAMVDYRPAPRAGHVQPRELVSRVMSISHGDIPISVDLVHTPGDIADANGSAHPPSPTKFPGLLVVMQQLAQPRLGQSRAGSQGTLAQTERAAKAALGDAAGDASIRACFRTMAASPAQPRLFRLLVWSGVSRGSVRRPRPQIARRLRGPGRGNQLPSRARKGERVRSWQTSGAAMAPCISEARR
jgi:hypothetical protein